MTEWTTHIPKFDGDAPEGVSLDTHYIECRALHNVNCVAKWGADISGRWLPHYEYRYRPRTDMGIHVSEPMATYEQVVAWCQANNRDVPAPPVDYEAWRPVMEQYGWPATQPLDDEDEARIDNLIAAFKLAMTIPACREVIEG